MPEPAEPPALVLRGLSKAYGAKQAVDSLDLTVPAGSFYGMVGLNGAGKTTTLSMAVGLLRPDQGTSHVLGVDVWAEPQRAKAILGVLPDSLAMPERLTGAEVLTFLGRLRGLPHADVAARTEELLHVLGLDDAGGTLVSEYSTGMRKKLGLAVSILHRPRVLVLDEPFEAVDPVSARTVRQILRRFVASGGSVIISSHVMALVESLCDHVALVDAGRVVAEGTVDEVRAGRDLESVFVERVAGRDVADEDLTWLTA